MGPSNAKSAPANKKTTCIIDLGVYTRNRLFRLMGSCKYGKPTTAALRIASNNCYKFPSGFSNKSFYVPEIMKHKKQNQSTNQLKKQESIHETSTLDTKHNNKENNSCSNPYRIKTVT